ncbi:hypothetical protein F5X68DRAFT_277156 [Plectosphaerella plurivora]|uniref:DNA mismatch repair protein HSM3 N-terminal domain-containing protein n=1 Tax=Plectosphaerella plurivora TaxID=936078 RepID=A0A9P8V914_9PEZI|nr:hypothetical protein F5X68DRAFT_277156 [Plectosphaerella plurivora]
MSAGVVPVAGSNVPISGLDELQAHLDALVEDPATPFEAKLFDDVELQLTETSIPPLLPTLLPKLTSILKTTQQDPKILVSLILKLLTPVSFSQTLTLADESSLIVALSSPAPSANVLAMAILHKAASSAPDTAQLASMPRVLEAFIRTWLSSPDVQVGERGNKLLADLLEVDSVVPPLREVRHAVTIDGIAWSSGSNGLNGSQKPTGTGQLWQRITNDPTIFNLLLSLPTGEDPSGDCLTPHQTSLAQGRLLRVLPRLAALDFGQVARPLGASDQNQSLLHFASISMVDKKDMLMHLTLIDYFEALLSLLRIRVEQGGSDNSFITSTLRRIFAEATTDDNVLKAALLGLPDRTVPEEADGLRPFVQSVVL